MHPEQKLLLRGPGLGTKAGTTPSADSLDSKLCLLLLVSEQSKTSEAHQSSFRVIGLSLVSLAQRSGCSRLGRHRAGQTRVDAARALREGDLDGHQAPSAAAVPAVPRASLPGSLAMAGKAQPLEVVEEQPAGKGPPGLVHQGPAGRTTVQGGRVAPESAAAASGRTADQQDLAWAPAQREARGPWEPRLRGLVCAQPPAQVPAQEAAHAGRPWGRIFELLWLLGVRGQADVKRKRLRQPLASGYRLARVALAPRGPPGSGSCAH